MSKNIPVRLTVIRTEQIAPTLRRVVLGGEGFADFERNRAALPQTYTDLYGKLVFLVDGFDYPTPLDLSVVRAQLPPEATPIMRTYTIRWVDVAAGELAIDFVVHGSGADGGEGVAGPWAEQAQPGDEIHLRGPNGGYAPSPDVDWHLFVGDESSIPAIAASLESLPEGARAFAFIEVYGPQDEMNLATKADLDVRWLHRGEAAAGTTTLLDDAVRAWAWPQGRGDAFVHGESALLKSVRPFVLNDQEVPRADVSVSAYWRRGATEEGFRVWKSQQTEAVMRPATS